MRSSLSSPSVSVSDPWDDGGRTAGEVSVAAEVGERLRVLVVAGILVGVVVVGVGSRLAMLLLRLTSPE